MGALPPRKVWEFEQEIMAAVGGRIDGWWSETSTPRFSRKARVLVDFIFTIPTALWFLLASVPGVVCLGDRSMSFLRHGKSIALMFALQAGDHPQGSPPATIIAMSFNQLFLGGLLSSRARLRFTGCAYCAAA